MHLQKWYGIGVTLPGLKSGNLACIYEHLCRIYKELWGRLESHKNGDSDG